MSGDKYTITDKAGCYFVTFTVIHWIDIFSRKEYRDIIVDSLNYCIAKKDLKLYAWVIMSNHVHLIITTKSDEGNILILSVILKSIRQSKLLRKYNLLMRADVNGC